MQGERMRVLKNCLIRLLDFFTENDRLQIIIFDNVAEKLTTLKRMNDYNKQQMKVVIEGIEVGGGTDIGEAIKLAFEQLKRRKQRNDVTSLFVLSDGGDANAQQVVKELLQNMNEVLTIHTFGLGYDHDEKMMKALSDLGSGNYYFVKEENALEEIFFQAFISLRSKSVIDLNIDVFCYPAPPFQDLYIQRIDQAQICVQNSRQYKIKTPYLSRDGEQKFKFEIAQPQNHSNVINQSRNVKVMEAKLKLTNLIDKKVYEKTAELIINFDNETQYMNDNNEYDQVVAEIIQTHRKMEMLIGKLQMFSGRKQGRQRFY